VDDNGAGIPGSAAGGTTDPLALGRMEGAVPAWTVGMDDAGFGTAARPEQPEQAIASATAADPR
jgi:hypothetical protein